MITIMIAIYSAYFTTGLTIVGICVYMSRDELWDDPTDWFMAFLCLLLWPGFAGFLIKEYFNDRRRNFGLEDPDRRVAEGSE